MIVGTHHRGKYPNCSQKLEILDKQKDKEKEINK